MEINEEDIVATYVLDDGCQYIFLADQTVYKKHKDGKITKIELNKNNIDKIKKDIGEGETDIVR